MEPSLRTKHTAQDPPENTPHPFRAFLGSREYNGGAEGECKVFSPLILQNASALATTMFVLRSERYHILTTFRYLLGNHTAAALGSTKNRISVRLCTFSNSTLQPQSKHPLRTHSPPSHICGVTVL